MYVGDDSLALLTRVRVCAHLAPDELLASLPAWLLPVDVVLSSSSSSSSSAGAAADDAMEVAPDDEPDAPDASIDVVLQSKRPAWSTSVRPRQHEQN